IVPPTTLQQRDPMVTSSEITSAQQLSVLGLSLDVQTWRWTTAGGLLVALLAGGVLAAVAFLGLGQDEPTRIRTRYRSMLMPVEPHGSGTFNSAIHVESMRDLARLAQRDG